MKEQAIKPVKEFRLSNLFLDFLDQKPTLKKLFSHDRPSEVALKMGPPKVDRNLMADVLVRQNVTFGAKPATLKNIGKLRQENTLCIFSGQQAGLYGGPMLTLYKAIGIVKRAALLEKELNRPVIPLFWIAADDHDFQEINHAFFLDDQSEIAKVSYDHPPALTVPASEMLFDNQEVYESLVRSTKKILRQTDFTDELYNHLFAAYSRDSSFVNAFGQYMLDILPDIGLILFSPGDRDVKTAARGFFKRLAEGHFKIKQLLEEAAGELGKRNYHVQVEKKQSAVHLFHHTPGRTPVHFDNNSFIVGDKTLGLPAMLDLIDKSPAQFSPDVLTRPIFQSYLFPVVAQAGGPSEIAYFAQIGRLFEVFGLVQPCYFFRPAATIVEKRHEDFLEKYDLRLTDLTGDIEETVNRVTAQSFPKDLGARITDFKMKFEEEFNELFVMIMKFDQELEPMGKQTAGKIDFALNAFEKKIYDHHKRRMESTRNQIYRLATALFPNRNLQERSLNVNYYIAKYGFEFVDFVARNLRVDTSDHQMIYISEMGA